MREQLLEFANCLGTRSVFFGHRVVEGDEKAGVEAAARMRRFVGVFVICTVFNRMASSAFDSNAIAEKLDSHSTTSLHDLTFRFVQQTKQDYGGCG